MSELTVPDGPVHILTAPMDAFLREGFEQLRAAAAARSDTEGRLGQVLATAGAVGRVTDSPDAGQPVDIAC